MTAGVYLPAGSLDRWRAARRTTSSALIEVLCFGDSTTYGQTSGAGGVVHPWPSKLRALLQAAGHPDGGLGLSGADAAPYFGTDVAPIKAQQGFARAVYDSWDLLDGATPETVTAGDWIDFQGYGTAFRLWFTNLGSIVASLTYSVDGGTPVAVDRTAAGTADVRDAYVGGLAEGLHTVRVTNVSGDARVLVDWLRTSGLVVHRSGVPGIQSNYAARDGRLGASVGLAGNYADTGAAEGAHPHARRVRLAIWALGINDQQGGDTTAATYTANLNRFITAARAAGADPLIVVPHYEAAGNPQYAPTFKTAAWNAATTQGVALVDFGVDGALGPSSQWVSKGYIATMGDPHLTPLGYDTQAAYLAPVLLNDAVSSIRLGGATRTVHAIRYGGATRTGTWH